MGGGGGGQSTTVQSIPDELKPLASAYTQTAIGLNNTPYQSYGGQRYADLNGVQMAALNQTADRAMNGSATVNNAEGQLNNIISGGNTNPYLDQMVGRAQDSVRSGMNTAAVNSGSFGNSGLQEQYAKQLAVVADPHERGFKEGGKAMKVNTSPRVALQDANLQRELREHAIAINGLAEGNINAHYNATTAPPTTGSHKQGDYVKNSAPVVAGSPGSQYVVKGWTCVADGSPGTWVPDRSLTGT